MLLPHAGASFGAFITQDDDGAGRDLPCLDGPAGIFHIVEYPGSPCKLVHGWLYSGFLYYSAFGSQIAVEDGNASFWLFGMIQRMDHRSVSKRNLFQVCSQGLS